jgi:hypothetical protein
MSLSSLYADAVIRAGNHMGSPGLGTLLGIILSENDTKDSTPTIIHPSPGGGSGFG